MINVGLVGYGYWGPNYARALREIADARLAWCCDVSPAALALAKERDPDVRTTTRLQDVLSDDSCEALVIVVPTVHHYDVARQAIEAGKHVLIEKPVTADSVSAQALIATASGRSTTAMVGHVYLFNPAVRYIEERIARGAVGAIRYLSASRIGFSPKREDVDALWDLAPHDISMLLRFTGGMPASVHAVGHPYLRPGRADVVLGTLSFEGGTVGDLQSSWDTPFKHRSVTIVGERETIVFDDVAQEKVAIYDAAREGQPPVRPPIAAAEPLKEQLLHFLQCVRSGKEPSTTLQDGLDVVRVLEALTQSLRTGAVVPLLPATA